MIRSFLAAMMVAFSFSAHAESVIIHGQTALPYMSALDNPMPSWTGARGEIDQLPYTVPSGHELCITSMAVEAYNSGGSSGIVAMFLMIGPGPWVNQDTTATVAANGGTVQMDTNYCWPEGTLVNLRLINGQPEYNNWVYGWQLMGTLTAIP